MLPDLLVRLVADPFAVLNAVGLVAFALVGATKAIREEFDLFGVTVVGLGTAFAGGATRDILVGRVPLALQSFGEISLGLLGVALAIALSVTFDDADEHPVTVASDAAGLAAFATAGAIVATDVGVSGFGVVAIAVINACGGGAFADILLDRSPFILVEDFYASCTVLGGLTYWLVDVGAFAGVVGSAPGTAAACCAAVTIGARFVGVYFGWHLPTAQSLAVHTSRGER
ncbi:TRIC cation channel family protein (plasmid) [Halarchaeum sp. CBA1220]|uniref:trimeric intracellular cation channel family protein n=1 Tax=Halarchaeum sp. CBA1220 TaxID=1853682 RepID=UPI000F3AA72C|nr:TRIC cation channel family protein [Halarchaeum sp. CBA1220]QLC35170.1 TRIC cation channel family protein [Halarchaeum sp. CBA1220]